MPNYRFHHVHFISSHPAEVAEFYEKYFGAIQLRVREHGVNFDIGGTMINVRVPRVEALVAGCPVQSGFEHLALRTDNLQATIEKLKADGVKILQDITSEPGVKLAYFLAPGDVPVEVMQPEH